MRQMHCRASLSAQDGAWSLIRRKAQDSAVPVVSFRRLHAQEASLTHCLFDVCLVVLPRPGKSVRVSLTTSLP